MAITVLQPEHDHRTHTERKTARATAAAGVALRRQRLAALDEDRLSRRRGQDAAGGPQLRPADRAAQDGAQREAARPRARADRADLSSRGHADLRRGHGDRRATSSGARPAAGTRPGPAPRATFRLRCSSCRTSSSRRTAANSTFSATTGTRPGAAPPRRTPRASASAPASARRRSAPGRCRRAGRGAVCG